MSSQITPQSAARRAGSATDPYWYKDAIIYELHVRAFADSNNDGIGDFPGLLQKLDYLQDLGVTCLWLLPFFPSPLRDDGYDIANYVDVNSSYGTLKDIADVLKEDATLKLTIVGHTDGDGDAAQNMTLSHKRADAVKEQLVKQFGIDAARRQTDGKGSTQPVAPNTTPTGKAENRRVEFIKIGG